MSGTSARCHHASSEAACTKPTGCPVNIVSSRRAHSRNSTLRSAPPMPTSAAQNTIPARSS